MHNTKTKAIKSDLNHVFNYFPTECLIHLKKKSAPADSWLLRASGEWLYVLHAF